MIKAFRVAMIMILCFMIAMPFNVLATSLDVGTNKIYIENNSNINSDTSYVIPPQVMGDKLMAFWNDDNWVQQGNLVNKDGSVTSLPSITISPKTNNDSDTLLYKPLHDGNILAYWYSSGSGAGLTDAYFQIIDQSGNVVTSATKINSADGELNRFVDVAELSDGNLAFVWATDGSNYALRRFQKNGAAVDGQQLSITALAGITGSQYTHKIVANQNGKFMILLSYYNNNYVGIIFDNGSVTPTKVNGQNSFVISSRGELGNEIEYLKVLPDGKFLAVYQKISTEDGNVSNRSVAFRIYNEDGTPYINEQVAGQIFTWGFIDEPILVNGGFALSYTYSDISNSQNPIIHSHLVNYDDNGNFMQDLTSILPHTNEQYGKVTPFGDIDGNISFMITDKESEAGSFDTWLLRHNPDSGTGSTEANHWTDITGSKTFGNLQSVTTDLSGNIYAADSNGKKISKLTNGVWSDLPGVDFMPWQLTTDHNGNLYASVLNNTGVKRYSNGSWSDVPGISDIHVSGMGVDYAGELYVIDSFKRKLLKLHNEKWTNVTWLGLFSPSAIAFDAQGNAYALDSGGMNRVVRKLVYGESMWTLLKDTGSIQTSESLACDPAGNIYVTDFIDNNRQRVLKLPVGGADWEEVTGDGVFYRPVGITADLKGSVYVVNENIQSESSVYVQRLGAAYTGLTDSESVEADKNSELIGYVAGDNSSSVSDSITLPVTGKNGSTIMWSSNKTNVISNNGIVNRPKYPSGDTTVTLTANFEKNGVSGGSRIFTLNVIQLIWSDITGNGSFRQLRGIAADSDGTVYVADFPNGNDVISGKMWKLSGGEWSELPGVDFNPADVAIDSHGVVYVQDFRNNKIKKFDAESGTWESIPDYDPMNYAPLGITIDSHDTLYAADWDGRIFKLPAGSDTWSNISFNTVVGGSEEIRGAQGIAVDGQGNVYVVSSYYRKVKMLPNDGSNKWVDITNEQEFGEIFDVAADSAGNVFVTDDTQQAIHRYYKGTWYDMTMQGDKTYRPEGITVDSHNNVYFTNSLSMNYYSWVFKSGPLAASQGTTATVADPPTNVTATAGDGGADVSFTAPESNGGSTITGYKVNVYVDGVKDNSLTKTGAFSPIKVSGLTNGTSYTFKVVAVNAQGDSEESAASLNVMPSATVTAADAPTGVSATAGDEGADISFSAPENNGGSTITLYKVNVYVNGMKNDSLSATGTSSPIKVSGLANGTTYTFRVIAVNSQGDSEESPPSSGVTPSVLMTVANAPTGVSAQAGDKQVNVSFTPSGYNGGSLITGYKVNVYEYEGSTKTKIKTATGVISPITVTGLTNGVQYEFKVVATNVTGDSNESVATSKVTPSATVTAADAPINVTAEAGDGEADVSFTVPTNNGGSEITLYKVNVYVDGEKDDSLTETGASSPIKVSGLTNGTAYTFRVVAVNAQGESQESAASLEVMPSATVIVPTLPSITKQPESQAVLEGQSVTFEAAASEDGSLSYQWKKDGVDIEGATAAIFIINNVQKLDEGNYTVVITNGVGNTMSNAAVLTVNGLVNATKPIIVTEPSDKSVEEKEAAILIVSATGTSLNYQWYSNMTNNNVEGTAINGATNSSYLAPTSTTGTTYYYCVITNTNNEATGIKTAQRTSDVVSVIVKPAQTVSDSPENVTAKAGDGQAEVSFTAPANNGGTAITLYKVIVYTNGIKQSQLTSTGTNSPIKVNGLTNGAVYTFKVIAVNAKGDSDESATSTPTTPKSANVGGAGGTTSTSTTQTTPTETVKSVETSVSVLVNGKVENAGTATTIKEAGKTITTVLVDEKKLEQKLAAEGSKAVITIPVDTKADVITGELNGQMVKNMETKQAVVEVKTDNASYTLPAQQINIDAISDQLGTAVQLKDIKVQIEISKPSEETAKIVANSAAKGKFTIITAPIDFNVRCSYDNKVVPVNTFNAYVERTVAIPDGVDPSKITTGIVVDADGTSRHVPTKVVMIDGKYYAKINSLTNSIYSVVWHPIEFKDAEKHWAKEAINDMGSRMVISGVGNDNFEPDRDITRAEFAAIIVRALGLKPGMGNNPFADVPEKQWYSDFIKTATEYKVISGYGNDKFGPDDKITREQAMTMIGRAMKITGLKVEFASGEAEKILETFKDSSKVVGWAKESIASSVKIGLVLGKSGNKIAPKEEITRAEVAVIIKRLLLKSNLI